MADKATETVQDSMSKIASLLGAVRKEAGEEPNNTSYMQTAEATPAKQSDAAPKNDNPEGSKVNQEKTDEAEAVGGNIDSVKDNKDGDVADAQVPEATDGPEQMDSETPVTGSGQMGSINHQDTSMDQKVASMNRSVGLVANYLDNYTKKEAGASPKPVETPAAGSETDALMQEIEKIASAEAEEYKQAVIGGMLLRVQDHLNLKEAMDNGILTEDKIQQIEALGGIDGFLDKVAMENPEAILPPEVESTEDGEDEEAGEEGEEATPAEGLELPAEAGAEDLGGELGPEDLAAIEQMLAEAGVTEEDLAASTGDIQALAESGASPEEAAQAADMLLQEELGEGGEKLASDNARVQACYEFLKEARDARRAENA